MARRQVGPLIDIPKFPVLETPPLPKGTPMVDWVPRAALRVPGPVLRSFRAGGHFASHKAKVIAELYRPEDFTFRYGDFEIITSEVAFEREALKMVVEAYWRGQEIPIVNPVYICNPPIMVATALFWTLDEETGEVVPARDLREDALTAIRMFLVNFCANIAGVKSG